MQNAKFKIEEIRTA